VKKHLAYIIVFIGILTSCSGYDKLLKSNDTELKYKEAMNYYEKGKYMKAYSLLENVATHYKGTSKSEHVLFMIAESYRKNEDYITAYNYYQTYTKTFPNGPSVDDCYFYCGMCYYELSPDPRLDQTDTKKAIEEFELYLDLFPNGKHVLEVNEKIAELTDKLVKKEYLSSKLYYNLGNYLGNNYLSAIVTAESVLMKYPNTTYKEDLMILILRSKYEQAKHSVEEKRKQRFIETIDEYYHFRSEFPNSKYTKEVEKIFNHATQVVK
jgi:outer membrane protein assembly factor BamD